MFQLVELSGILVPHADPVETAIPAPGYVCPTMSDVIAIVPVLFGSVQDWFPVRSAVVRVPVALFVPEAFAWMLRRSCDELAVSRARFLMVAPPVKEEGIVVVAPLPVTVARVSDSAPSLLLKVVQSVDERYPSLDDEAWVMDPVKLLELRDKVKGPEPEAPAKRYV